MSMRIWVLFATPFLVGCEVRPIPADKLFAFSNPTLKAEIPDYGKWSVPTNFKGQLEFQKPDGTKLTVKLLSNASKVVSAEGDRAEAVEDQRIADEARALQSTQILSTERSHAVDAIASVAVTAMPLLAARSTPSDPSGGGNPLRDMIRSELERILIERTGGPATPGNGPGPVIGPVP